MLVRIAEILPRNSAPIAVRRNLKTRRGIVLAVAIPVFVLLLIAAVVGLVATSVTRDEINRQDAELKKKVSKRRTLQSMGNSLVSQCEDSEVRQEVQSIS